MYIFIDTTVFRQDLRLAGAAFRMFKKGLPRLHRQVLVPRVVVEETIRHHVRAMREARYTLEKARMEIQKNLMLPALELVWTPAAVSDPSLDGPNYAAWFTERLKVDLGAEIVDYPEVSHADLVQREMAERKPFNAKKNTGYRDALIWETIRGYVTFRGPTVIFVTGNSDDFGSGPKCHPDLAMDLEDSTRLRLYSSIDDLNADLIIPTLARLDEMAAKLQARTFAEFDLQKWIEVHLVGYLHEEDEVWVMNPLPVGLLEVQTLAEVHGFKVDIVHEAPWGEFIVYVTVDAAFLFDVTLTADDLRESAKAREYFNIRRMRMGETLTMTNEHAPARFKVGFYLMMNTKTFAISAFRMTDVEDSGGRFVSFEHHPRPDQPPKVQNGFEYVRPPFEG